MMEVVQFDWFEYIVLAAVLLISASIGVFLWCFKGGQNTVLEYYFGNKQMSVFPVSMSLIASYISGMSLLGLPSEVYYNGLHIMFVILADTIIFFVSITVFQPVFYKLQLISLYEYLELRFDHRVRVLASGLFAVTWILRMPVLIYGVALVFNQVSGVSLHIVSLTMSLVCMFYTTVGGLRAVVWTDALQGSVMILSTLIVLVVGLLKVGGFHNVLIKACEGGRLEMFDMNPDPTERLTFWSSTIGITFMWMADATNPLTTQRYLSLPSLKAARKVLLFLVLGLCLINLMSGLVGLIIYANYSSCDPLSTKKIERPDQILPYFILDVAGHLKGLSGLFVAGIVCAGISSLSTGMNTLAGTFYRDFIESAIGSQSDKRASSIMKALSVIIGVICIALVPFVERFGNIIDMGAAVGGVTSGAIFGVFTMGVLIPRVNNKGAFYGGLASSVIMMWTMIGHQLATNCYDTKPVSIDGCSNITNSTTLEKNTCEEMSDVFKIIFPLYKLTAFYYGFMGFTLSLSIGIIISYITGFNEPNSIRTDLLSPIITSSKAEENTKYAEVPLKIIRVTTLEH